MFVVVIQLRRLFFFLPSRAPLVDLLGFLLLFSDSLTHLKERRGGAAVTVGLIAVASAISSSSELRRLRPVVSVC